MTDHDPNAVDPQTRDLRAALSTPEPRRPRDTKNISPLVWIVLILLVGLGVFAWTQYGGSMRTPTGGEAPIASDGQAALPGDAVPAAAPEVQPAPASQ